MSFTKLTILAILFCLTCNVKAQDIFNLDNSIKYANYLYKNHETELAEKEYHRLFVLNNHDSLIATRFFICNYKLDNYSKIKKYYSNQNCTIEDIYVRSVLLNGETFNSNNIIFNKNKDLFYQTTYNLLNENYTEAIEQKNLSDLNANYNDVFHLIDEAKFKKAWVAGVMSAVVPGSGKVYSGFINDGIISFLFTSVSTWQAYRGFDKQGIKSPYGWIYSGMSLGFYVGNIYGSVKAANKHNSKIKHRIKHATQHIFKSVPY